MNVTVEGKEVELTSDDLIMQNGLRYFLARMNRQRWPMLSQESVEQLRKEHRLYPLHPDNAPFEGSTITFYGIRIPAKEKEPQGVLDSEYIKNHTSAWALMLKTGRVELWNYHDSVDYKYNHCIKVDGVIKTVIDDSTKMNPYSAFDLAVELLAE